MHKPFDQKLYDENDQRGKQAVRQYLERHGCFTNAKETCEADFIVLEKIYAEVEIKRLWRGEWPSIWSDVHIPERKKRLAHLNAVVYFFVVSADLKQAWIIPGKHLNEDNLRVIQNSEVEQGERFFCVPIEKCKLVKLDE